MAAARSSRSNAATRAASTDVVPARVPLSISAWVTQPRSVSTLMPSCRLTRSGVAGVDGVGAGGDDVQLGVRDELGGAPAGDLQGHHGVGVAVDDQDGDVDLGHVAAEVGRAERGNAVEGALRRGPRGEVPGGDVVRFDDRSTGRSRTHFGGRERPAWAVLVDRLGSKSGNAGLTRTRLRWSPKSSAGTPDAPQRAKTCVRSSQP